MGDGGRCSNTVPPPFLPMPIGGSDNAYFNGAAHGVQAMSDKVDIWMPLYVAEWDLSTGHLSNALDGAYGRLVRWYWKNGRPPADDDEELASIIRVDVDTWQKSYRPKLEKLFRVKDGVWLHLRVESTMKEWAGRKEKASSKASGAAKERWAKERARHDAARKAIIDAMGNDAPSNAPSNARRKARGTGQALLKQCPSTSTSSTEVIAPQGAITLSGRNAPILPHEGQSAIAPFSEDLETRRAVAAKGMVAVGIRKNRGA